MHVIRVWSRKKFGITYIFEKIQIIGDIGSYKIVLYYKYFSSVQSTLFRKKSFMLDEKFQGDLQNLPCVI